MKISLLSAAILAFNSLLLHSPAGFVHASPPLADSVHLCIPFDYEQCEGDHPHPAAKPLADLNVGEPRTVRMIYFLPNDRPYRAEVVQRMKDEILRIQTFYAEQMKAHGYGFTTFRVETDPQGKPMVHRVDGRHPENYYADDLGPVFEESEPVVAGGVNIRLIVIDNSTDRVIGYGGFGERLGKNSGYATVPGGFRFATAAHELGHAFGLEHDFRDGAYIMSYGPGWNRLSACSARFLSVHSYFNSKTPIEDGPGPTVELISPRTYPAGSRSVPVQFQVNHSGGLHQVSLRGLGGLVACRELDGEKSALVEFDYDGVWRVDGLLPLPNAVAHTFFGEALDSDGNLSAYFPFTLVESSPYRIATLEGHTGWVRSVAFSSDGRTLASGLDDGTVKLWDADTQQDIGTLRGHTGRVRSVAFSSDGRTLASGSDDDGTVKLWDVDIRELVGTLEGHRNGVISVAFWHGATLASGSWDGTVKLWDVGIRELVGTLGGHSRGVTSVAFSPDGATLASGSWDSTVKLWDVETQKHIGILRGHIGEVTSVAFSPLDGTLLASGSVYAEVKLWNVITGANLATFGNLSGVNSVAFSYDGATLASGTTEGTIELWDLSEWTGPRPYALEIISGDGQQGAPGEALTHPLVVEVRDQYGDLLPEAAVTFSITAGGGTLSVETTTTDPNGRATTTLTLGPDAGPNTVTATVAGLDPVTFSAVGSAVPHTLTKLSGHDQQVAAGTALTEPFVVEVKDQKGHPLEGAQVTFSITAGGGTLSVTTDTTDTNGRASTTLTLGRDPGRNAVTARVGDLKPVIFGATGLAIPTAFAGISGDDQQGTAGAALFEPFVIEVRDQNNDPLEGAEITFSVTAGGGTLSAATATTDANGRAATTLTLGRDPETVTVTATVAGLDPVTFTATAEATPDFDGDGETGFSDFFLFADAFGGSDPRFDLDGSGTVNFGDFFLLADHFGDPARGKLLALAREMIGLPDGPQLQQNAPNPFNNETVITWFLLRPGPARVEVFALTGQRVGVLHQGPKKAGIHRVHWDGRDGRGRPLASGVYLYRLVTDESIQTRKLTLLR